MDPKTRLLYLNVHGNGFQKETFLVALKVEGALRGHGDEGWSEGRVLGGHPVAADWKWSLIEDK